MMNSTLVRTACSAFLICLLFLGASSARADAVGFGVESFETTLSTHQAGGHPDAEIAFTMNTEGVDASGVPSPVGYTKGLIVDLPAGLAGNPTATPTCTATQMYAAACPAAAQVGTASLLLGGFGGVPAEAAIYNLVPDRGDTADLAFDLFGGGVFSIHMVASVRSDGDYGLRTTVSNVSTLVPLVAVTLDIWGVPADHNGGGGERRPFLTNPTQCGVPESASIQARSWEEPATLTAPVTSSPIEMLGCEALPFAPTVTVSPESQAAGEPSGLTVDVGVPQTDYATQLAASNLKDAVVSLPAGVTLSASVANGLVGCTDGQFGLHAAAADSCPPASKIGSVRLDTPLLAAPMEGAIYVGSQESSDPQSGKMFRIFTTAEGSGVRVKLEGHLEVDPATGRITTSFTDNPQLPFTSFSLRLNGGARAPLLLPQTCGTYQAVADFTGYSAPASPVRTSSPLVVDQGCGAASAFTPALEAGTANPLGGAFAPFTLRVTRPAGQANLASLATTLPEGLLADLGGVPLCGEAEAATGTCASGSQVGKVTVVSGAGDSPLTLPQPGKEPTGLYLAGPYKGAPYSLVAKVPAQAGPFDLGTVVVRNSIQVDPLTTQVTVSSDPLPQILQGVPVSYRDLRVEVDRPRFMLNPTDCDAASVAARFSAAGGGTASATSRFQVGECASLPFRPTLKVSMTGQTKRSGNPALKAVLTQPTGSNANVAGTSVILPKGTFIDQSHINNPCTRVQFNEARCPANSILGTAKAWSPLLERPLEGPVYFRSNGGERQLPDLVADLNGQLHVILVGFVDSVSRKRSETSRVRTRFQSVPDAPVSRFELKLYGGRRGLIQNSQNLCQGNRITSVFQAGQNGKTLDTESKVQVPCAKSKGGDRGKK